MTPMPKRNITGGENAQVSLLQSDVPSGAKRLAGTQADEAVGLRHLCRAAVSGEELPHRQLAAVAEVERRHLRPEAVVEAVHRHLSESKGFVSM